MLYRRSTISNTKFHKKRKKSVIPWKKEFDKIKRCQPKGPPLPPTCSHSCNKYECSSLGQEEMESFHKRFYYTRNRASQDAFILRHCEGKSPKRRSTVAQKKRRITAEYYVPTKERKVQVCRAAFVGILQVNKYRIDSIIKSFYTSDDSKRSSKANIEECPRAGKKRGDRRSNNSYTKNRSHNSQNAQIESLTNTCMTNEENRYLSLLKTNTFTDQATFANEALSIKQDCSPVPKQEQLEFHRSRKLEVKREKKKRESIFSRNCLNPRPKEHVTNNCNDTEIHVYKTKNLRLSRRLTLQKNKKKEAGRKSCVKPKAIGKVMFDIENESNISIQNKTLKDEENSLSEESFQHKSLSTRKSDENVNEVYKKGRIRNLWEIKRKEASKSRTETQGSHDIRSDILCSSIVKRKQLRFCTSVSQPKDEEWRKCQAILHKEENRLTTPILNQRKYTNKIPCGSSKSCPIELYKVLPKPEYHEMFTGVSSGSRIEYNTEEKETDWLNSKVKQRRVRSFDWSPLRQSIEVGLQEAVRTDSSEIDGCPQLSNKPQQISKDVIYNGPREQWLQEIKRDDPTASIGTKPIKSLKVFEEHSPGLIYESNRRRLGKLQRILEEKENIPNNNKQRQKAENSIIKPKLKPILIKKNIENNSLSNRTENRFEQKSRFPLQTIQYFKNQRFIYGKT